MGSAREKKNPRRGRRWIKRSLIAAAAGLAALLATPFLFTGSLVRYFLARTPYCDLRFESARLSPLGRLTLYNVALDDTGQERGKKLIAADKVELSFRWADVHAGRLQQVALENLDVTLRPGKETPITLLRLIGATPANRNAPASPGAAPAGAPQQQQFALPKQILINGVLRFEGYGATLAACGIAEDAPVPIHLLVTSPGGLANLNAAVSLAAGKTDGGQPQLSARLNISQSAAGTILKIDNLSMQQVSAQFSQALVADWSALPEMARHAASAEIDSLSFGGSLTLGSDNGISLTAELRDLSARATDADTPLAIDHLAAGLHVEGRLTDTPFDDLTFSRMRMSWNGMQAGNWKLGKGLADLGLEGTELEINQLQTNLADAEVDATGAIDLMTGLLTRGSRLLLNHFSAPDLIARFPESWQRAIPCTLRGTITARLLLEESDAFHMTAFAEILCPDQLQALKASPGPAAATATSWGVFSNLDASGTIYYALQPGGIPDVSHGRLTADQFLLTAPRAGKDAKASLQISKIKSDFTIAPEKAVLNDFYGDLPGNGRVTAEGTWAFAGERELQTALYISGMDASLINPWLAPGWSLSGQIDGDAQVGLSSRAAQWHFSLGLAPQTILKGPGAQLSLTSALTPSVEAGAVLTRSTGSWNFNKGSISNIGALQADAGMIQVLRNLVTPSPGGDLDRALDQLAGGAGVSFDLLALTGTLPSSGEFSGNLNLHSLDLRRAADQAPLLQGFTLQSGVALKQPLGVHLRDLRLTDGVLFADKIALGGNPLSDVHADLAADQGKLLVNHLKFDFAEGAFDGSAAILLPSQLQSLHLTFSALNQQALTRSLYPEVFTAEGPVSGDLMLSRGESGSSGTIDITADKPGKLKIAPAASEKMVVPAIIAAAKAQNAALPSSFNATAVAQLADYPYQEGHAELRSTSGGMTLSLDYRRQPPAGDSQYSAFDLQGVSVPAKLSLEDILQQAIGWRQFGMSSRKPAAPAR